MAQTLLIMGPTASGKSALALALARRTGAAIVNADAMQAYRDLRVLTARPSAAEEAEAPHHLYGHVDASVRHSVGDWLNEALGALADIAADGRPAIIVGGTGLYFKALTEGLAAIPPPQPAVRAAIEARLGRLGPAALHAELGARDPAAATQIAPMDGVRIARALEVLEATGASILSFYSATAPALASGAWVGLALTPPRDWLYARINARFAAMMAEGAAEEAAALLARGLDPLLPAMKAHGMPWFAAEARGEIGQGELIALSQRDTRRYAKRQFTWIGGQMPGWARIETIDPEERCVAALQIWGI